eukprot:gene16550-22779_t
MAQWRDNVNKGKTQIFTPPGPATSGPAAGAYASKIQYGKKGSKPQKEEVEEKSTLGMKDPDIRLGTEYVSTETALQAETRKQNEVLDQIENGVSQLLEGARNISEGLKQQHDAVDGIVGKATGTSDRVKEMNTKSQLGAFKKK